MGRGEAFDHHDDEALTLGSLLRLEREARGLSQQQMAEKLGSCRAHLSKLERDQIMHPSPRLLLRVSKRLHIPIEDLYALTGILVSADLPDLGPYLRAKHPDWPDLAVTELMDFCNFIKDKYSL
jgi:transcriptional regulator with XRE-family HTH domain